MWICGSGLQCKPLQDRPKTAIWQAGSLIVEEEWKDDRLAGWIDTMFLRQTDNKHSPRAHNNRLDSPHAYFDVWISSGRRSLQLNSHWDGYRVRTAGQEDSRTASFHAAAGCQSHTLTLTLSRTAVTSSHLTPNSAAILSSQ